MISRMGGRGAVKAVAVVAAMAATVLALSPGFWVRTCNCEQPRVLGGDPPASQELTGRGDVAGADGAPAIQCAPAPCEPVPCAPTPCEPVPCEAVPCDSASCPICSETECKPVPCSSGGDRAPGGAADISMTGAVSALRLPGEGDAFDGFPRRKVFENEARKKESGGFKTRFADKEAVKGVTLTLENVCVGGRIGGLNGGNMLFYGLSEDEVAEGVRQAGYPKKYWDKSFNCNNGKKRGKGGCFGHATEAESPDQYRWVEGTTAFVLGQQINTFHSFADAMWPFFVGQLDPSNSMSPSGDTDHVWLGYLGEMEGRRETVSHTNLWQLRMAMLASPKADLLELGNPKTSEPVCFERLRVTAHMCCHFSPSVAGLGEQNHYAALRRFRNLTFNYLQVPSPPLRKLGEQLRVTFYGRTDARRRRVANQLEVMDNLDSFHWWLYKPGFRVSSMDGIYMSPFGPPSYRQQVLQFASSDILLVSHGAGLWASLFVPENAALAEIHGPCISSKITWIDKFAKAVPFTHDRSNPTLKGTAGSGRTSSCGTGHESGDYNIDIAKLQELVNGFLKDWPSSLPDYKPPS